MERLAEFTKEKSVEEFKALLNEVEEILTTEQEFGKGRLGKKIPEIAAGPHGMECFSDERITYLPPRGRAIIVGDTHGDSISTQAILEQTNFLERLPDEPDLRLVFLGDIINGEEELRNLFLALSLKQKHPQNVILLGGNHESSRYSPQIHIIWRKLERDYEEISKELYADCLLVFKNMPVVLVCGNGLVGVHGGIPSQDIKSLLDLKGNKHLLEQILWSDPTKIDKERIPSARTKPILGFVRFGADAFSRFMEAVGGSVMVRGHEPLFEEKEALMFNNRLLTVFSTGVGSSESRFIEDENEVPTPIFAEFDLSQPMTQISQENIHPIIYF
jgi:hypothetical protein